MLLTIPLSKLIGVMENRSKNPRQAVELIDEEPALEGEAA